MKSSNIHNPHLHHIVELPSPSPTDQQSMKISTLLHPDMISMLPNPLPFASGLDPDPPYEICDTPDRGFGMFAARPISKGTLITVDHPLFIVPETLTDLSFEAYEEVGRGIPEERYRELTTMANCRTREECPSIVEGVTRTNAMNLQFPFPNDFSHKVKNYGGPFPTINRRNHSCGPNSAHRWDHSLLSATLYALRDIQEGEEITHTYSNPLQSRDDRWRKLQSDYRFDCDCPWCNHEDAASQDQSDSNREYIQTYVSTHPSYRKWIRDPCLPDNHVIDSHLAVLPLIRQEGLDGLLPLFMEDIVRCYAELGAEELFRSYAKDTLELCIVGNPTLSQELNRLLENPQQNFPNWGRRKRKMNEGSKRGKEIQYELEFDNFSFSLFETEP